MLSSILIVALVVIGFMTVLGLAMFPFAWLFGDWAYDRAYDRVLAKLAKD